MKGSELKGRAVVTLQEAAKIGTVSSVILDPTTSRVLGLKIKTGLFSGDRYVVVADIRSVGNDAVTVPDAARLHEKSEEVPELKGMPDLDDIENIKVVSESGSLVGAIDDVLLDMQTYSITSYQLGGSLWQNLTGGQRTFQAPQAGMRFGKGLLIVPDSVAAELGTPPPAPTTETPAPAADASTTASADYGTATTPTWTESGTSTTGTDNYRPSWGDTGTRTDTSSTIEPSTSSTTAYPPAAGNLLDPDTTGGSGSNYGGAARLTDSDNTTGSDDDLKGRGGQSSSSF